MLSFDGWLRRNDGRRFLRKYANFIPLMNDSPQAVLQWYQGTGLRPYLKALPPEQHPEFEREILSGIESLFPRLHDGSIVFKFPRLFFIAGKKRRK